MRHYYKPFKQRTLWLRALVMLVFGALALNAQAQISLTSSAGSSTSANYSTLKAAIDNINNGTHTGSIVVLVHANTTEAAAITLNESGNASGALYTDIMIRPADTATSVKTITATFTAATLLTYNGADNVTIDGRPLSTGTAKLLTITNPNNVAASHTIALSASASFNMFTYCTIDNGAIGTTASSALRLLAGLNANNTILNATISGGNLGIEIAGTNGAANNNTTVRNCLLVNQKATAIRLASGVGSMIIDSNNCTHTVATSTGGYQFLNITLIEPTSTVTVTKNRVYDLNTSAANFLQGIIFSPAIASGTLLVRNNSISLGSATFPNTLSQIIRCFLFGGTLNATVVVEHNTFRIGGTHVTVNGQPTTVGLLKSNSSASSVFTSRNNLCINTRAGSANQHVGAFYSTPTTGTNTIDYNTYYGGPTFLTAWIGTFHGTIATYKAAATPNEQNSTFGLIDFNNVTDPTVNFNGVNTSGANLIGTPIGTTTDYFGTPRSTVRPYRGAFESTSPIDTFDLQTVIIYTYGKIPIGTDDTIRVLVRNKGAAAVTNEPIHLRSKLNGYMGSVNVSLAAGNEAIINIVPYTPFVLGFDTLTVNPNPDQKPSNDTAIWVRENTLNALSYSRPFLAQSGNVGTNPDGEIVAKFYTPVPNFVNQVNVNFTNAFFNGPFPFQVVIYEDSGSTFGPKMNPYWVSSTQNTINGIFNLSIPSVPVSGSFYIGVRQTTANNIGFAFQNENPIRNRTFYFRQGTGFTGLAWNDFAVNPSNQFRFMIEPRLTINDDLGVIDLFAPGTGCVNIGTQAVSMQVQNLGLLSQNFAVDTLRIFGKIIKPSGNTISFGPVLVTSGTLAASATLNVTVLPSFNFDSAGAYTFTAWTRFGPDGNAINDTLPPLVRNVFAASVAPVIQNFNAATFPTNWTTNRFLVSTGNGTNTSNSIRVNINNSSPFAANAYIQSPRISGITTNHVLRFDYRVLNNIGGTAATLLNTDSIKVMVSTDCGNTFTQLALINGVNHTSSANYTPFTASLAAFTGVDVVVKIVYEWFGTTNDVIIDMDNIRVVDGVNDVGVSLVSNPCRSLIAGSSAINPSITVRNFGSSTQTNIPVAISITGPSNYNATSTVTTVGSGATAGVVFVSTFNPSVAGVYTLKAWTAQPVDGDRSNDTLVYVFNVTNLSLGNTSVNGIQFTASSMLNVKNTPALNLTNSFTMEAWINRSTTAVDRSIISKDSAVGFIQYNWSLTAAHQLNFFMNTNTNFYQFTSAVAVPTGFSHVAATFNGTNFRFYINGAVVLDTTVSTSAIIPENYDITIGNDGLASSAFLGTIDELRIWNTVRTASDIRANMHTRLNNSPSISLMAYYRFDEGATNTFATDASGNCNAALFGNIPPTWVATQYPLGTPIVGTQTPVVDGTYALGSTGLSMIYSNINGTDTIYAHKFSGAPIGSSPLTAPGGVTAVHPNYWMLYRYGNATTSSTNLLFNLGTGNLSSGVSTTDMRLFTRAVNNTGTWTQANATAASVSFALQNVSFAQTQAIYNTQLTVGANNNPLPVVMLYFTAKSSKADAILRWATASENNCKGFIVERSVDGETFEEISFTKGNGNSNVTSNYSYADRDVFVHASTVYYRLKQVDFDGSFTESEVVVVNHADAQAEQITIYPNPVKSALTIEMETLTAGAAQLHITDLTGKSLLNIPLLVSQGFNKYIVNELAALTNGLYLVTITQNDKTIYTSKVVKSE